MAFRRSHFSALHSPQFARSRQRAGIIPSDALNFAARQFSQSASPRPGAAAEGSSGDASKPQTTEAHRADVISLSDGSPAQAPSPSPPFRSPLAEDATGLLSPTMSAAGSPAIPPPSAASSPSSTPSLAPNTSPLTSDPASPSLANLPPPVRKALADAQTRLDSQLGSLRVQSETLRQTLAERAGELGKQAQVQFGLLGGRINEVTGYREVEKLKETVREKELQISSLRELAAKAKIAYDDAVNTRAQSQRDVTSLLERKHIWTDADVSQFTSLVRSDHSSNLAVAQTKVALLEAEASVEKAFDELMKAILERYHEEQVWSDKIRSVSTYGSLTVLVVNLVVFIGAILVVEPWKRKSLVQKLEEKVSGMMEKVEGHLARDLESVKALLASIPLEQKGLETPATLAIEQTPPARIAEVVEDNPIPVPESPSTPPSQMSRLTSTYITEPFNYYFPSINSYASQHPRMVDTVVAGTGGLVGGVALMGILMTFLRNH